MLKVTCFPGVSKPEVMHAFFNPSTWEAKKFQVSLEVPCHDPSQPPQKGITFYKDYAFTQFIQLPSPIVLFSAKIPGKVF